MKKILINIFLATVIACAAACLAYVCILYKELSGSPEFLVHEVNYELWPYSAYVSQWALMEKWEGFLKISISMSAVVLFFSLLTVIVYNFVDVTKLIKRAKEKRDERIKRKIERLQKKVS